MLDINKSFIYLLKQTYCLVEELHGVQKIEEE
jgi:hypothetical protein